MIDLAAARELLDFNARHIGPQRAEEQLQGAVALHNILERHGVAYLADEVGMGKTYVALGALALFRHFQPGFRALIIAPRENIQVKWMKELRNFVQYNVRFADLRVKAVDGTPVRPLIACRNLIELVREVVLDPDRDFFLRLTSFSLGLAGKETADPEAVRKLRDALREHLPWVPNEVFDLRSKQEVKNNFARALCCALPPFDLVIVDEGHNLKHGLKAGSAARNHVLSLAFGNGAGPVSPRLFPGYRPRAKRVLFLSATPIEETYTHLWNQLDVFGRGALFEALRRADEDPGRKKALAAEVLIRRVTAIQVAGQELTKNLYRREWRRGGVKVHDDPIEVADPRQRLVVALVQKKVSELLGHEHFNGSFQIGMLASFESFLETTKLKRSDDDLGNFDDGEQTDDELEREGIDVRDVNRLARNYRSRFDGQELPHPKMDAVVESVADAWIKGRKGLLFVRRVASVKELKRKLDARYDQWLFEELRRRLPPEVQERLEASIRQYAKEKLEALEHSPDGGVGDVSTSPDEEDRGGNDTFFAWFFRGDGPKEIVSGATIQRRFIQRGAVYATFFEDNYVAALLQCRPGEVLNRLTQTLGASEAAIRAELRQRGRRFLTQARRLARADRLEAAQAAAVEMLKDHPGPLQEAARYLWHERFESSIRPKHAAQAPELAAWLETATFFTELRERPALRARLWPEPEAGHERQRFRERELRGQLLATAARLGHAFIDLYVMTIQRLRSLDPRAQEESVDDDAPLETDRIHEYLDLLEEQMATPREGRAWAAFDELADLADHFDLILDVNVPEARGRPLSETARTFGALLRQQRPIGGMSGQVNQTLVRQFRMPGYPLILVTTDLLQEGEDLHTFCSAIQHYGISWTPSSMEQRIGRIDRVRSQTERRLAVLDRQPQGEEKLQVFYPFLGDTVEILQVQRVLERMNVFLRLMHEDLTTAGGEEKKLDVAREMLNGRRIVPQIQERLQSAFPVKGRWLTGDVKALEVGSGYAQEALGRFARLRKERLPGLEVVWEPDGRPRTMFGQVVLGARKVPFKLTLDSLDDHLLVRCASVIGRVSYEVACGELSEAVAHHPVRICATPTDEEDAYQLSIEEDQLLADPEHDAVRAAALMRRVAEHALSISSDHLPDQDRPLEELSGRLKEEADER